MFYSEEDIKNILDKYNIVEEINKMVPLKKVEDKYIGFCPFHKESIESFIVDEKRQIYYCFICGKGGNLINFYMDYFQISFLKAIEKLTGIKNEEENNLDEKINRLLDMNQKTIEIYQENLNYNQEAKDYIKTRCLLPETMKKFKIGYSSTTRKELYNQLKKLGYKDQDMIDAGLVGNTEGKLYDKFTKRLMFPIQNENGDYIGFCGRIIKKGTDKNGKALAKYINSMETILFDKSSTLFGFNFAKESQFNYFILCEGQMDVISLHQANFTNAIASMGTALTEQQVKMIRKYKKNVLISYDMDAAGIKAAKRAIQLLERENINIRFIDLMPYKDPDEFIKNLGVEAFQERIKNSKEKEDWLLKLAITNDDVKIMENL